MTPVSWRSSSTNRWATSRCRLSASSTARRALVLDGRFAPRDPLAVGRDSGLGLANRLASLADLAVGLQQPRFDRLGRGHGRVALVAQRLNLLLEDSQALAQTAPIDQAHLGPQLLEPRS